tara:strand:+ start:453 stop:2321 length:1869 start_codon:yes stop_codon:yes gene_type:complete
MGSVEDAGIAFLEGFLGAKGKKLERADLNAQRYYDMQMELASRNLPKIKAADTVVNNALGVVNQVKSMYGTEDMILAAQSMGPDGLVNLRNKMTEAQNQLGGVWNAEYVKDIWGVIPDEVRNSEAFLEYSGTDTTDFIRKSMGRGSYTIGDFKAPKDSFFSRLDGRNKMARTRQELDQMEFAEGMSAYDINQSANAAQYQSLIPGAFIQYPNAKTFDMTAQNNFSSTINASIIGLSRNPNYSNADSINEDALDKIKDKISLYRNTQNVDKSIINLNKLKSLRIGQLVDSSFKANESVTDEEFNMHLEAKGYTLYNSDTIDYINSAKIMKDITTNAINNRVDLLKINYGESVINDTALRSILTGIPNYDLPAMVDSNGDSVEVSTESTAKETPVIKGPGPSSTWKVLNIERTDTENKFIVNVEGSTRNDTGELNRFTMIVEDPLGLSQISMPLRLGDDTKLIKLLSVDEAAQVMKDLKGQLNFNKLMKQDLKLPEFKEGGASVLGEAETETITQIDEDGTSAEKTFQGLMGRDQFNRTLARIRKKVSEGYKDVPAGLGGGVTSFFRDDPQARERRETSIRAFKWFRNKATTYFKQQPNQILEAEKDPVAWYIRYEKQFLTESK